MICQPTPEVTSADVERILRRDFSAGDVARAVALLERYGDESRHREVDRVRLAVLKLAAGNLERLAEQVENAAGDYRDAIGPAEYPRYLACYDQSLKDDEKQRIVDADWRQYQQWLQA